MSRLEADQLDRYDSLFVAPHADDVMLACPTRVLSETEKGRRVLLLALFEPIASDSPAARSARGLGADFVAAGLPSAGERGRVDAASSALSAPEDEAVALEAARLLTEIGPRTQAVHVFAPLGLGFSIDHRLAYEATVRAFATEPGRNLFLYEERPEAFVPGAVRTRLALLGARLPPAAQRSVERAGLLRHLWFVNEPRRLRGETRGVRDRLAALGSARRRLRQAGPWNPSRAFGPRLQPILHHADDDALRRAREIVASLLPVDAKGRPRAAERFHARAAAAARQLGGTYHAERFWLFLPSGDGLPEVQHPLEMAEA
jgi:LmbE family N-acetylglucosaminyl deacetylase